MSVEARDLILDWETRCASVCARDATFHQVCASSAKLHFPLFSASPLIKENVGVSPLMDRWMRQDARHYVHCFVCNPVVLRGEHAARACSVPLHVALSEHRIVDQDASGGDVVVFEWKAVLDDMMVSYINTESYRTSGMQAQVRVCAVSPGGFTAFDTPTQWEVAIRQGSACEETAPAWQCVSSACEHANLDCSCIVAAQTHTCMCIAFKVHRKTFVDCDLAACIVITRKVRPVDYASWAMINKLRGEKECTDWIINALKDQAAQSGYAVTQMTHFGSAAGPVLSDRIEHARVRASKALMQLHSAYVQLVSVRGGRVQVPVRGSNCKHIQPFDLFEALQIAGKHTLSKGVTCRLCSATYSLDDVYVDSVMLKTCRRYQAHSACTIVRMHFDPIENHLVVTSCPAGTRMST